MRACRVTVPWKTELALGSHLCLGISFMIVPVDEKRVGDVGHA